MSKYHIVGNHMSRRIYKYCKWPLSLFPSIVIFDNGNNSLCVKIENEIGKNCFNALETTKLGERNAASGSVGRALDWGKFETHRRRSHCVVSLSKHFMCC